MADHIPDSETAPTPQGSASSTVLDYWRRWHVWIVAPVLIGVVGVLVAAGCDQAAYLNKLLLERFPRAPVFILPAGFAFLVYLVRRFFRGSQGSGIPQAIAVVNDSDPRKKHNLLSLRILIGKALMLLGGLSIGASIGREGPTVQIGASIMHAFYGRDGEMTAEKRRMLVMAGGAAGIAAAFNTPLAGVMFAIEELGKRYVFNAHTLTLLTVTLSGLVSLGLVGHYTYFGSTPAFLSGLADMHVAVICGIAGGVMGGIFSRLMIKMTFRPPRVIAGLIWNRPLLFAGFCGFGVALLGLLTDNMVFGSGYEVTRATLESGDSTFVWYYGLAKMGATFLSSISGIPGGLFAPTLSVGAGLGDALSLLFPALAPHAAIVLLVMAAYLSGITRTPLTALVITMEMTSGLHLLLPLMVAVLVASGVSKLISREPLYHALAQRFMPAGSAPDKGTR